MRICRIFRCNKTSMCAIPAINYRRVYFGLSEWNSHKALVAICNISLNSYSKYKFTFFAYYSKRSARVQCHHRRCQRPNDCTVDRSRRDLIVAPINDLHVLVLWQCCVCAPLPHLIGVIRLVKRAYNDPIELNRFALRISIHARNRFCW